MEKYIGHWIAVWSATDLEGQIVLDFYAEVTGVVGNLMEITELREGGEKFVRKKRGYLFNPECKVVYRTEDMGVFSEDMLEDSPV